MNKLWPYALVAMLAMACVGCIGESDPEPTSTNPPTSPDMDIRGISLSPKSYQQEGFTDFFEKVGQAGPYVTWAGSWEELNNTNSAPYTVIALSKVYGYTPIILLSTPLDDKSSISDTEAAAFKDSLISFIRSQDVVYIALGVEVNALFEKDPNAYQNYVDLFSSAANSIRACCQGTEIMAVFQLERMKGLHGGLFGEGSGDGNTQWQLLDDFEEADIIAFTTYPCLVYKDPSLIPSDYYADIADHTSKPLAIVESGWFRSGPSGWESSSQEQAEFVDTLFEQIEVASPRFVIWSFLYDQSVQYPFDTMGLLEADGDSSPAWEAWKR